MKPIMRYQSQLLFRKSYKPIRMIRIRPVIRPVAQKQSTRPISERTRSVTALDDQRSPCASALSS